MKREASVVTAHHQTQGGGDVFGADVQVGGALAIDNHAQLGAVEFKRRVGVDDAEIFGADAQTIGVVGERFKSGPRRTKSISQLPLPILNDGALRTETRRSVYLATRAAQLLHDIALRSGIGEGDPRAAF